MTKQAPKPFATLQSRPLCQGQPAITRNFSLYTSIQHQPQTVRRQRDIFLILPTILILGSGYWKLEDQIFLTANFLLLSFLDFFVYIITCANKFLAKCSLVVSIGRRQMNPFAGTSPNSEKYSNAR